MCRIRPAATAQVGFAGGMNLTFKLDEETSAIPDESEVSISSSNNAPAVNFIVVPSPTMLGAYRFEAAYYPGSYLAFKAPHHLRVLKKIEDTENTIIDFSLVKYDTMFKYITMEEVLLPVMKELPKDSKGYCALDQLRYHDNVVMYFKNILGSAPWDLEDFETYFDAHWQQWFYSGGKIKLRTRDEQLVHSLRKAKK